MVSATEQLAKTLKSARTSKGLNQRELAEKAGLEQPQISKIERGAVDLRVSTLVAIARVLDLEIALVPRKAVPAVQSIVRSSEPASDHLPSTEAMRELRRLRKSIDVLPPALRAEGGLAQLKRQLEELQRYSLGPRQLQTLKETNDALRALREIQNGSSAKKLLELRNAVSGVERLRNELAHASASATPTSIELVRPAYSLDDEDDSDA